MKEKHITTVLFVIGLSVLGVIYIGIGLKDKPVLNTQSFVDEPVKENVARSMQKSIDTLEIQREKEKVEARDIKVIAKTNKEAEKLASEFYNEIFSIAGLKDGFINNVEAGESISVNNFHDETEPASQFVPLYANNKIVGISIFREYFTGEKELGIMTQINEEWYSYPPIKDYDAELEINTKYPTLSYTAVSGYYFIEDRETPYYLYEGNDGASIKYIFVSAYNKAIVVKHDRGIENHIEENPPVKISKNGLMELDRSAIANLAEKDLNQLKSDIELTNKYIKEGIMKFDENFNIIYDKRNKEKGDIFTSEENSQYHESDLSEDEMIGDSGESASVIK